MPQCGNDCIDPAINQNNKRWTRSAGRVVSEANVDGRGPVNAVVRQPKDVDGISEIHQKTVQ